MKAVVQNFRGIAEAQIAISPIALVTGRNGAGKTSIARAVAAAVTGRAVPYDGVTKKDCAVMLRAGTRMGTVTVTAEEGSTTIGWPKAECQSDGRPPFASPIAAGLTDLFSMKDKDALTYLINLLRADVGHADFITAFEAKGISKDVAEAVWATVDAQGWEAAHLRAKEKGTKLKGAWENTTREKYGSKKAEEWVPLEWEDSLLTETAETLQAAIASARTEFEASIAKNAVSQAEREALRTQAESVVTLETQKTEAQATLAAAEQQLTKVEDELKANPNPDAKAEYACPHCDGKVHINAVSGVQYVLTKAGKIDESKLKEARTKNAKLCGEQQNLSQKVTEARRKLQSISSDLDNANRAKQKLAQLGDAPEEGTSDRVASARAAVAKAEMRLKAFEAHRDATKTTQQIADNQTIIGLLDETGLRRSKLTECLYSFQTSHTDPICQSFCIPQLLLDADLNCSLGKIAYPMLSASEQFRVRTVLQLAIAQNEHANLVIIDGADILDQGARGKLLQAVLKVGIPAIICMTLNKPDMAPDLAAAGAGVTYWVENGTCTPVEGKKSDNPPLAASRQQPDPAVAATPAQPQGFFAGIRERRDGAAA